jgi:hypothetical protein
LVGRLFGPRVFRMEATVVATPPPRVTTPTLQFVGSSVALTSDAAAFAAAISARLNGLEVFVSFFAIGMAAGDQMRGVVSARRPDQEDDSTAIDAQALQPKLPIVFSVIFHGDHWSVKDRLQIRKIDLVLAEVLASLRLVPADHAQIVDAICAVAEELRYAAASSVLVLPNAELKRPPPSCLV